MGGFTKPATIPPPAGGFTKPATTKPRVIETKVLTGAAGGGLSAVTITPAVLWLLGVFVFGAPSGSTLADLAITAVPWPLSTFVGAVIVTLGGFVGGFIGRHTARPDLAPDETD